MEFDHPASFDTIAMEQCKKQDIIDDLRSFSLIDDLRSFSESRDHYRRIGKPWKRGYLLHGPPGTEKSTMIAVMANELNYDVYDLELTAVTSNANLKKLLNRTPCNSILVIEDIACLSDISGLREKKQSDDKDKENVKFEKVMLFLNYADGLFWGNEGGRVMTQFPVRGAISFAIASCRLLSGIL
ncbi:AAA-ATPase [Camellia lanceoleosa]|uniref:AAA-ATPase n=1 Tax=Camellia lanceoleosa TaxID=1840588 RepID=A0ACC0IUV2_9ERIC|nr:AAA-ATPase [Camellia lanceoleosa]